MRRSKRRRRMRKKRRGATGTLRVNTEAAVSTPAQWRGAFPFPA